MKIANIRNLQPKKGDFRCKLQLKVAWEITVDRSVFKSIAFKMYLNESQYTTTTADSRSSQNEVLGTLSDIQPVNPSTPVEQESSGFLFTLTFLIVFALILVGIYYLTRCLLSEDSLLSMTRSGGRHSIQPSNNDRQNKDEPVFSQKVSSIDSDCYFVIRGIHPEEHSLTVRRVGTDPMYQITEPKKNKMDEVFTKDTIEKSEQLKSKRKSQKMNENKSMSIPPLPQVKSEVKEIAKPSKKVVKSVVGKVIVKTPK
jgi:hypothetical protein